ncbi:MAG TPA: HAD-IA family hydrolase [Novosphingobium sp.]|jgi:phosphoglycolate phosphatase|nr:HAD-IA family hydrolase [Novosphingobium sp.]
MTSPLAVFDCDGTLVDGQGAVVAAMESAFRQTGLAVPDPHLVRRMVGLSLPQAVARLAREASAEQVREAVAAYKTAFRAAREAGTLAEPLFPGIAALLDDLAAAGWTMAVATGKSDRGLAHCLASHGIADRFTSLQTAERHPSKPDPAMLEAALFETDTAPEAAVMIGDTAYDMAMAAAIGVRAVGVAWGYHEGPELIAAGAAYVARDAADLKEYLLQ